MQSILIIIMPTFTEFYLYMFFRYLANRNKVNYIAISRVYTSAKLLLLLTLTLNPNLPIFNQLFSGP